MSRATRTSRSSMSRANRVALRGHYPELALFMLGALIAVVWVYATTTTVLFTSPSVAALTYVTHGKTAWENGALGTESGLSTAEVAEGARQILNGDPAPAVEEALGADSANHLVDVGRVVSVARGLALIASATLLLLGISALASRGGRTTPLAPVLRGVSTGTAVAAAVVAAVGLLAAVAFDAVFVTLHEVLFEPGTWTFPAGSLLIQTFPEQFWMASAAAWVAVAVSLGAVLRAAAVRCEGLLVNQEKSKG